MSYTPTTWNNGDVITAEKLNKLEQGVQNEQVGPKGDAGENGAAAGFGQPTATIDANTGTPSVTVQASGPDTAKVFTFAFKNLKGAKGDKGETGSQGPQGPAGPTQAATTSQMGAVKMAAKVDDAAGEQVTKQEFNNLLTALKNAGIMSNS